MISREVYKKISDLPLALGFVSFHSSMFIRVLVGFIRVHSCSSVFARVHHSCLSFVIIGVHSCSFVFHSCSFMWCFRLDRQNTDGGHQMKYTWLKPFQSGQIFLFWPPSRPVGNPGNALFMAFGWRFSHQQEDPHRGLFMSAKLCTSNLH